MTYLCKYITEEEFCHSDTAIAHGVDNCMNSIERHNAFLLCGGIIEPIMDYYGLKKEDLGYDSGFRNKEVNDLIKGSRTSEHCNGNAIDPKRFGNIPLKQVFNDIVQRRIKNKKSVPVMAYIDQIIYEFGGKWLHIGRRDKPRHQVEKSVKTRKGTEYFPIHNL